MAIIIIIIIIKLLLTDTDVFLTADIPCISIHTE